MKPKPSVATRAVVSDDGREIRLTVYNKAGVVASVVLDPARALRLAHRLLDAVMGRLPLPFVDRVDVAVSLGRVPPRRPTP